MKVELLSITPECEKLIETAGRTCYQSKVGNPSIIKSWIKSGHESVIEHASATFRISEVSRAMTHQLVRHRLASFSQQSQRYIEENGFSYVIPDSMLDNIDIYDTFEDTMNYIQESYNRLRELGIKKEDARAVLPNATHTEIIMTINFRSLRNFLKLRGDQHAQKEIRMLAKNILEIVMQHAPNVFGDIEVCND